MRDFIEHFELGAYVGQVIVARVGEGETGYINGLINRVIENSRIEFNEAAIDAELPRILSQMRESLEADNKPIRVYCYVNGITEDELPEFTRRNIRRTAAENRVIREIAAAERIEATEKDLADYKSIYREQYARTLLDDPTATDENLKAAIQTKKVLTFLMRNNTWREGA